MSSQIDDFKAPSEANTEPQSDLHKAALKLVEQRYRLIPISPNGKTPLLENWHANAIDTAEDVDRFWTENPDANIAICPDDVGMAVIDVDPGASPEDVAALAIPDTYEVATPRGGTHYYLAGSINPTVGKLAPHIDTRGRKSYVLVPPSIVDGKLYAVKQDRPIPMLPIAIEDRAKPIISKVTPVEDVDLAGARQRATTRLKQMVKDGTVAIEGQGGDNLTYQTAVELVRDLGLPPEDAAQLMLEHWNPYCDPPWEPEEIAIKCVNAAEYGQNEIGARAVSPLNTTFAGAIEKIRSGELRVNTEPDATSKEARGSRIKLLTAADIKKFPDPKPLVEGFIMQRENVIHYGDAKLGKSFTTLDMALSIAANRPVFGTLKVCKPGPVVYLTAEGQFGFKERLFSWEKMTGVNTDALPFRFYTDVPHPGADPEQEARDYIGAIRDALPKGIDRAMRESG